MKLKASFITQDIDETLFLVPVGLRAFQGVIRGNKSAAFIVDCLKQETTEDAIVDKMYAKYDAPRQEIAAGVSKILDTLRSINALEE